MCENCDLLLYVSGFCSALVCVCMDFVMCGYVYVLIL